MSGKRSRRAFLRGGAALSLVPPLAGSAAALWTAPARAQGGDWQADWDRTVAAAKGEGHVTLCISPGLTRRDFLLTQWQADYPEIEMSITNAFGAGYVAAVATERAAGRYLWDVYQSGAATGYAAIHAKQLDPLMPEFILPEIKDPKIWGGWETAFYDLGKTYILALVADVTTPYYDAKRIDPQRAGRLGLKLLLEPDLKGKIVWFDPRIEGPGPTFLVLLAKVLGDDGLTKLLYEQDVTFVSNFNNAAQMVARGKASMGMGGGVRELFKNYIAAGLPIDIRDLGNTPDKAWLGTDGATLGVFNQRPHPNAARIFVNWIMSKRISEAMAKATDFSSRRTDIPPLHPEMGIIPGALYVQSAIEENLPLQRKWMAEAKKSHPQ